MKIQFQSPHLIIFESALFRTTTTLLIQEDYILLVDPNWLPNEIEFIGNYVERLGKNKAKYLLFTHSDYDHIIGYGFFPVFQTIASENFVNSTDKLANLAQINKFDDEYYIKRSYPITYPSIDIVVKGNPQTIQISKDTYHFYQARGHNNDGIITYNKTQKILIVGDYLSNIEFPYIYDSVARYKNTLATLTKIIEQEAVSILITGHGDYTEDKNEMLRRIHDAYSYLNDLENSIRKDTRFDLKNLFERYQFPQIMTKFHKGNVTLMQKELKKQL